MSQCYLDLIQALQSQLKILQEAIASQLEPAPQIAKDWQRSHIAIQTFFQTNIVNTELEVTPHNFSLQVEINKQLKILGIDLTMLQTSRNPTTWQKRHQQTSDRLQLLQKYCQMHAN